MLKLLIIFYICKHLYIIISNINSELNIIEIVLNNLLLDFLYIFITVGNIRYINNNPDIPKNNTDLKHINPFILP